VRVAYLSHVDGPTGQRFEAQDRSVLVAFPPLQHYVQRVSVPLQDVRILKQRQRCTHGTATCEQPTQLIVFI
jgi:hypothetical protein